MWTPCPVGSDYIGQKHEILGAIVDTSRLYRLMINPEK